MPYLRACIHEALRLNPPAIPMQYRVAPPSGDVLPGYEIPTGTWVGFSVVGIMRNVEIFGEDVKCYRPERWLEADPERVKRMEATVDLCFLYGK